MPSETIALEKAQTILGSIFEEQPEIEVVQRGVDALEVDARAHVAQRTFLIEYKSSNTSASVDQGMNHLINAKKDIDSNAVPLLVVPYMTSAGKKLCEGGGVSWIDLSGNAFIRHNNLYVRIEGKPNQFKKRGRPRNPFAPKSSRIVRHLLSNSSQRFYQKNLVEQTDVSKALVSQVINYLEEQNYVHRLEDQSIVIEDPTLLLNEWQSHYTLTDHSLTKGHIHSKNGGPELVKSLSQKLQDLGVENAFTGLASAWHYSPFSNFRLVTAYIQRPLGPNELRKIGMSLEPKGANVWLIQPNDTGVLWGGENYRDIRFVSPLQTYLDLGDLPERSDEARSEIFSQISKKHAG
ncbi:MAG: hypothetical protein U5K31_05545 [Balneolaceae bacterium]|nr:hypothetical protein [Balneolaceae bacterium]